jgi:hypothetical protein
MSDYDYGSMFLYPLYGSAPVTAEDHRAQAVRMLREASQRVDSDRAPLYLAAAHVHATLALTAPEAARLPVDITTSAEAVA